MVKSDARKWFRNKRKSIPQSQKAKWDDLLLIRFQQLQLPYFNTLLAYAAIDARNEIPTDAIVDFLHFQNPQLQVAYPVCNSNNWEMQAILTNKHTVFTQNAYGIPEPNTGQVLNPQDIDVILVPLLCFDVKGYRVGYGKGVYDKFMSGIRQDAVKIGLSYFDPIDTISDHSEFDVPLNYCITPERIYEF